MKEKDDGCYSCTRGELLAAMRDGAVLWWGKFGPHLRDGERRELHPRRDTVHRLLQGGVIVETDDANQVQRECGMGTYRLAARKEPSG